MVEIANFIIQNGVFTIRHNGILSTEIGHFCHKGIRHFCLVLVECVLNAANLFEEWDEILQLKLFADTP